MERCGHRQPNMLKRLTIHVEENLECTALAVQCLSVISHIDYDLVLPCVPRILPFLLQVRNIVQFKNKP